MPGIRHRRTVSAPPPQPEFGRGAWILIGAMTVAVGAVFHAVAGLVEIVRDMMRTEPPDAHEQGESPAVVPRRTPHEAAGWVLIAGAGIAVGALSRVVADLAGIAREILRGRALRS